MFCSKCGALNDDDSKFCSKCGAPLGDVSSDSNTYSVEDVGEKKNSFDVSGVIKEKEVKVIFAILVLLFGLIGIFTAWVPFGFVVTMILGFINAVLQTILIFQWADVINTNIDNTRIFINQLISKKPEKASELQMMISQLQGIKIDMTMFWVYMVLYVLSQVLSFNYWITPVVSILAFIFLMIYLQNTFSQEHRLLSLKNQFYGHFSAHTYHLDQIKKRNVGLLILFVIITLGIYWWYILIKHSQEINDFVEADVNNRRMISM